MSSFQTPPRHTPRHLLPSNWRGPDLDEPQSHANTDLTSGLRVSFLYPSDKTAGRASSHAAVHKQRRGIISSCIVTCARAVHDAWSQEWVLLPCGARGSMGRMPRLRRRHTETRGKRRKKTPSWFWEGTPGGEAPSQKPRNLKLQLREHVRKV